MNENNISKIEDIDISNEECHEFLKFKIFIQKEEEFGS